MAAYRTLEDGDFAGKRVLVRVDFNLPMDGDTITDDTRLRAALPTITALQEAGAKVVLMAHRGRPKGEPKPEFSLAPIAPVLASHLSQGTVSFAEDTAGPDATAKAAALAPGDVLLVENTRFQPGEEANDPAFVSALAALGEAYVNEAFSAAHRAHASTEGLAHLMPAYAGKGLARELDYLAQALGAPERPVMAVVGGAKVSSKIAVLTHLTKKADMLVVGGGMANTFLAARGVEVGASLMEADFLDTAREIEETAKAEGCRLILPTDVVVAREFKAHAESQVRPADEVAEGEMILDLGPDSVDQIAKAMDGAKTLVWNGPLGAFEMAPFDTATVEAARYAAKRSTEAGLVSVAGGGDTVAALNHAGATGDFTFVSTAGGAFLEWLEGRELPGIAALAG